MPRVIAVVDDEQMIRGVRLVRTDRSRLTFPSRSKNGLEFLRGHAPGVSGVILGLVMAPSWTDGKRFQQMQAQRYGDCPVLTMSGCGPLDPSKAARLRRRPSNLPRSRSELMICFAAVHRVMGGPES